MREQQGSHHIPTEKSGNDRQIQVDGIWLQEEGELLPAGCRSDTDLEVKNGTPWTGADGIYFRLYEGSLSGPISNGDGAPD